MCVVLAGRGGAVGRGLGQHLQLAVAGQAGTRPAALPNLLYRSPAAQGFWARLTVHEPQPEGDVERGWHSSLAKLVSLGTAAMAAARIDRLPPGVLVVLQHALLCTLPILALALLTERLQRGSGRGVQER